MQLNTLIGKKTYQKQGFLEDGRRVPLTGVMVSGNIVTQIKTAEKEGYNSIQLGIDAKKRFNKALLGHAEKALANAPKEIPEKSTKKEEITKITPKYFREVRLEDVAGFDLGSEVNVAEVFAAGDVIDVTGVSKGKGWAGGVKRYHFRGGPRTHGQSDRERAPGSIGQTTTPGRVYKGKKMAGRMGSDTVTVKNLEIIEVTNDGVLLVKGLVPGRVNGLLLVKKVGENKKFVPLYKEVVEEPVAEEAVEASTEAVGQTVEEVVETQVAADVQEESAAQAEATEEKVEPEVEVAGNKEETKEKLEEEVKE